MGQRVTFTFHYTIYAPASRHTAARRLLLALQQSLIRRLLQMHLNGISRWTSQLLLRGSFSKRSMGRRVNGSLSLSLYYIWQQTTPGSRHPAAKSTWAQRVNGSTGHVHFHYIIYDSRRRKAHATPLHKAHGVWSHQAHATPLQKSTQRLLLARWVNFLVHVN